MNEGFFLSDNIKISLENELKFSSLNCWQTELISFQTEMASFSILILQNQVLLSFPNKN